MEVTIGHHQQYITLKYLGSEPYGSVRLEATLHHASSYWILHTSVEEIFELGYLEEFVTELKQLEEKRQGKATLRHIAWQSDVCPFHLEIFSTDPYGYMAVSVDVQALAYIADLKQCLSVNFGLDAGMMISIRAAWVEFLEFLHDQAQ